MKKILLATSVIAFSLLFQSCNKRYTCTCVVSQPGREGQIIYDDLGVNTESDANYKCDVQKANLQSQGVTAECHI